MAQKRLLICSPARSLRGGVESIISELCRELPGHGWQVIFALGKGSRFNDVEVYNRVNRGLPTIEIDGTRGTRQSRLDAVIEVINSVGPDVILSARIFDVYRAVTALKREGRSPRFAVTIRGYEADYLFDAKVFHGVIDLCVTDGRLLAAAAQQICGIDAERVVSIPGGIRPPGIPVTPRVCQSRLKIGYVGRLAQSDKRVLDIVPVVELLDQSGLAYDLVIAGDGPEGEQLRKRFEKQTAEGRVTFAGWVDAATLYEEIYPRLDCLVQFSASEGVTIAGREAMVNGVVPVTSEFIGLRAEGIYLDGVNCLTFQVGDINAAADALRRLSEEKGLLTKLSANAIHSQSGEYTYNGAINSWAAALNRCVEMEPTAAAIPSLNLPPDGRLARLGVPDRLAQRIRDLARRRSENNDASGEWPTNSGLMDPASAEGISRFAADYEAGRFSEARAERVSPNEAALASEL